MEQIFWERVWIDRNQNCKVYTVHGTKEDLVGSVWKDMSLWYFISNFKDFEAQEKMLQLKAMEMGVLMDHSPKCHCKLAREGFEYALGCTKNHYR
jgi:hypothetical protein